MTVPPEQRSASALLQHLLGEREALAAEVTAGILREMPELTRETRLTALLEAAVTENVLACMHGIALGTELSSIDAPPAGVEHARILAQQEVSITVLLRVYRLGQTRFTEGIIERARSLGLDASEIVLELVRATSVYIDRVSHQVTHAYEAERELRLGSKVAVRQHWVSKLLTSTATDVARAEAALRYRLHGWHVAVEAWVEGEPDGATAVGHLDRAQVVLARSTLARGDVLSVPTDRTHMRIWLPVPEAFRVDSAALAADLVAAKITVRMAIGDPRQGVEGFRTSAATAAKVKSLALSAGSRAPSVLAYADVMPLILVAEDQAESEHFVAATLGDLALPDPRRDELRETLLIYLESNRSYHAAAIKLHLHRNTVHYRVQQAVEQAGADLDKDSFALQLALMIRRWRSAGPAAPGPTAAP
ncbi:MAG: helix-turn-helix domain-containing protein [Nocardioidaceae bacterium]|nr:helix-turn-helix domain-containing protein [Nocardioidaceae bacterium]